MDEWTLNDLLECSVCLERLDTSSKVLPCQHTFCKKCLEEIVSTHKELRCPECRVLVDAKIDELPPNVLLMRILEGMRNAAPKKRSPGPNRLQGGSVAPVPTQQMLPPPQQQMTPLVHPCPKQSQPSQPCARAIYDYIAKEPGDLSFKKGDMILLRKKIDTNWYQGEIGGHFGAFPLTYVQVITPLPNQIPQCKALYDFRMTNDDDEGCLTFNKGEVITVLRRIDENWAEGRLGDRIGIFPLAFVELNVIARALMKLSTNSQPGPSRLAPPTPTSEDTTPLIPTDHSVGHASLGVGSPSPGVTALRSGAPPCSIASPPAPPPAATPPPSAQQQPPQQQPHHLSMQAQIPQQAPSQHQQSPSTAATTLTGSESSSSGSTASSSSTTPNTSSSNTSSSSSTAPSSPTSPPPPRPAPHTTQQQQPPPPPPRQLQQRPAPPPPQPRHPSPTHAAAVAAAAAAAAAQQHRDKRHSFSALHSAHMPTPSHRHSAEILSPGGSGCGGDGSAPAAAAAAAASADGLGAEHPSDAAAAGSAVGLRVGRGGGGSGSAAPDLLLQRQSSKRHRRTASGGDKLSSGAAPPPPQGVGLATGSASSHLPAAYIALYPYKPQKTDELELKKGGIYLVTERCEDGWFKGTSNRTQKCGVFPGNYVTPATTWTSPAPLSQLRTALSRGSSSSSSQPTCSTSPASPRSSGGSSCIVGVTPPLDARASVTTYARGKQSSSILMPYSPRQHNGVSSQQQLHAPPELPPRAASPSHTGVSASWHGQPVGVVASSSASAVPDVAAVGSSTTSSTPLGRSLSAVLGPGLTSSISAPPNTSVSAATSSPREKGKEKKDKAVSLMRRLTSMKKSKSPPPATYSMDNPVFEDGSVAASPVHPSHPVHPVHVRTGDPGPVPGSSSSNHRKSNSLDASSGDAVRKVNKQLVPPVRERFRCIVPYPPMSDHELELRVGDVIYVHRKREDGWYKGTLQRTGRTGLFPASFVESF